MLAPMALEHALLVALSEQPASGLDLDPAVRPLDRLLLARHPPADLPGAGAHGRRRLGDGHRGRPDRAARQEGVRRVARPGARVLADWLAAPTPMEPLRSELAVKMRGASYGDRAAVLEVVRANLADHATRLAHYEQLETRDYPAPRDPDRPRARPVPRPARRHPHSSSSGSSG